MGAPAAILRAEIGQHPVAELDRVVEAQDRHRRAVAAGEVLEDPLAPQAGLGVLADRAGRRGLVRAAAVDGRQRVDVAGGEGDQARPGEGARRLPGQVGVGGPGLPLGAGGAELARAM